MYRKNYGQISLLENPIAFGGVSLDPKNIWVERAKLIPWHKIEQKYSEKFNNQRENLEYCKKNNIRMNGPKLGRPPKDKELYRMQCEQERDEAGERNIVEAEFGNGKRNYGLDCIKTKLQHTSEVSICMTFIVMNLEKRLKSFLLYFFQLTVLSKKLLVIKVVKY